MQEIIIDTNFFVLISNKKIDIFQEIRRLVIGDYKLLITTKIFNELKTISKKNQDAKFGLKVLEDKINKKQIEIIENYQHPDDFIPIFAKEHELIVCTNDADLRKKSKKAGAKVISLRANKRLDFI